MPEDVLTELVRARLRGDHLEALPAIRTSAAMTSASGAVADFVWLVMSLFFVRSGSLTPDPAFARWRA